MFTPEQLNKATAHIVKQTDLTTDEGYVTTVALCLLLNHSAAELTEKYGTIFGEMVTRLASN